MQPNPPITGQAIKLTANNAGNGITLVCVVHANVAVPFCEVHAIARDGSQHVIGRSEAFGKDDSGAAVAFADGTVRLFVSEADPGGGGITSHVTYYDFPNAVPAQTGSAAVDTVARGMAKAAGDGLAALLGKLRGV